MGSMRDEIRRLRERAELAEAANAKSGAFVEQERAAAKAAVVQASELAYMAGADAAGLRIRLEDLARNLARFAYRLRILFRAPKRELELVEAALSGKVGQAIRTELGATKTRELLLAHLADDVRSVLSPKSGVDMNDAARLVAIEALVAAAESALGVKRGEAKNETGEVDAAPSPELVED